MPTLSQALLARGLSVKDNLNANTDPSPSNDATQGYQVGSSWMNVISGRVFRARGVNAGTAVWTALGISEQQSFIINNWYNTGRWSSKNVGVAGNNGRIILYPVAIPQRVFISALGLLIGTPASGNAQCAVYAHNPATGRPTGLPLAATGNLSTAVQTNVNDNISAQLDPGFIWFATNLSSATATLSSFDGSGAQMQYTIGSASQGAVMASQKGLSQVYVTQAFGTWPDLTSATFVESASDNNPIVQFKIGVFKDVVAAANLSRGALSFTAPGISPVGIVTAQVFATSPALSTDDNGNVRYCFKIACQLAQPMKGEVRVTLRTSASQTLTISHLAVGKWTGDPNLPATVDPLIELLYSGASGFVQQTGDKTSDWTSSGSIASMQAGDYLLVSFTTGPAGEASLKYQPTPSNAQGWYQSDSSDIYWNAQSPLGVGFNSTALAFGVVSIDTRGVASAKVDLVAPNRTRGATSIGVPAFSASSSGGGLPVPGSFNEQTGTFTIAWDASPNAAPADVLMGLSNGVPSIPADMACAVRFGSSGFIEARNAGAYAAAASLAYTASTLYHFRMVVRLLSHSYDIFVTPPGQSEVAIGSNYAFRTDQAAIQVLNYLGKLIFISDASFINMAGPPAEAAPPVVTNGTFSLTTIGAGWTTGAVVGGMTASRSPTAWAITAGDPSGYFAISNSGIITVTSAGITALGGTTGSTVLTAQATNANGSNTGTATITRTTSATQFPKSMTDPMYSGMTELNDTLDCVAGTTYNKRSWIEHNTGSWSALMASNVTCNTWRMRTREGPRFRGYTNVVFNNFMLEVYGVGADHADGTQWEGGANSVTFKNCHIRVTPGAYTGVFAADGSTGTYIFEDCLFSCESGGGTGLIIYADAGFGTIKLSMKNCYFQQTGWGTASGPMLINSFANGTSPAQIILWDNVRYCAWNHSTGTLTPGGLIPQPAST